MVAKKQTEESFASRLEKLMVEHDPPMDIKALADALKTSYEHSRKMVRGLVVPTRFIILALADIFHVDPAELEAVAKADTFKRKYGESAQTPIFNPEVAPFATAWQMLTDQQKTTLLSHLKTFIAANAKKAKTS